MDKQHEKNDETQHMPLNERNDTSSDSSVESNNEPRFNDEDKKLSDEFDQIVASTETTDQSTRLNSLDSNPTQDADNTFASHVLEDTGTDNTDAPKTAPRIEETKNTFNFNKYFLYTLVAGLVLSALISVAAVLTGEFSSTMARALGTTGSMVIHTVLLLFLISFSNKKTGLSLVLNTVLFITVASFITSILGIWDVLSGQTTYDLYTVYFYTFVAVMWVQLLMRVGSNLLDKPTRIVSFISIGFTGLLYLLFLPTAFVHYPDHLPEFNYRAMAAAAILLATASVLTSVFRRIYLFKHHELKGSSTTAWDIIIACVVLFFGIPVIFGIVASISSYSNVPDYSNTSESQQSSFFNTQGETEPGYKQFSSGVHGLSFTAPGSWRIIENDLTPNTSAGDQSNYNYQVRAVISEKYPGGYLLISVWIDSVDTIVSKQRDAINKSSPNSTIVVNSTKWRNYDARSVKITNPDSANGALTTESYLYVQVANRVYLLPEYDQPITLYGGDVISDDDWRKFIDSITITLA